MHEGEIRPRPSAARTLILLILPALLCVVLGLLGTEAEVAVIIIALAGPLIVGIWTAIRIARLSPHPGRRPWIALGLIPVMIVAAGILCYGGCLIVMSNR